MGMDLDRWERETKNSQAALDGIDPFFLTGGVANVVSDLREANVRILALIAANRTMPTNQVEGKQ